MATRKRAVTIQDVAEAAGVSVSTVSRVLNAKVDVAIDTQERILTVIDELGYTTNLAAKSMRSLKKNLLGLIIPDIGFPYSIEIMKGIDRAIAESDYDLLLFTTGGLQTKDLVARTQYYVSLLNNSLTDGVLIVASDVTDIKSGGLIVSVDPHLALPNYPSVQGTNYQGAKDVMRYLISLGHKRIGFIDGWAGAGTAERRIKGYRDGLKEAEIEIDEALIVPGDYSTERAKQSALVLLKLDPPPTAIFASNDQSALGVYHAAETLGLRVPDDVSVVGFDNIAEAKYIGLTTVDQSLSEMGYIATQMLIQLVNGELLQDSHVHKVPTKLIIRSSCRALTGTT